MENTEWLDEYRQTLAKVLVQCYAWDGIQIDKLLEVVVNQTGCGNNECLKGMFIGYTIP